MGKTNLTMDSVMTSLRENRPDVANVLEVSNYLHALCENMISVDEFGVLALALQTGVNYIPNPDGTPDLDLILKDEQSLGSLIRYVTNFRQSTLANGYGGEDKASAEFLNGDEVAELDIWYPKTVKPTIHFGDYIICPDFFERARQINLAEGTISVPDPVDFIAAKVGYLPKGEQADSNRINIITTLTRIVQAEISDPETAAKTIRRGLPNNYSSREVLARIYKCDNNKLVERGIPFSAENQTAQYFCDMM